MAKISPLVLSASPLPQFETPALPALPVPALPLLQSGFARGEISEITGARSSGKTTALFHVLAQATARGEVCAWIDTDDNFHPASAAAAGVKLTQLLWIRCGGNAGAAMRTADLLLHAGGFGVVVLDLAETKPRFLDRIPLSYWYRFRRAIENTPTVLLVCSQTAQARAATTRMELAFARSRWEGSWPFRLLRGLEITARLRKQSFGGQLIPGKPQQLSLQARV
jgi:hypothetical protein